MGYITQTQSLFLANTRNGPQGSRISFKFKCSQVGDLRVPRRSGFVSWTVAVALVG